MVTRYIADLHLGHKNVAIWRGFKTAEEHDEHVIKQWNSVVGKRDLTIILGDISMHSSKVYPLLDRLNGIKEVFGGNHDDSKHTPELLKYVRKVGGCKVKRACVVNSKGKTEKKDIFISHVPIHPREFDYRVDINLHGHTHDKSVKKWWGALDKRYICVSCEQINYTPITLAKLCKRW